MFFGVCNIKDIILSSDNIPMMIDQLYANNISIISISLCFAQHGCKADIVVKFWQPLCGDRKHHPLIVDSFGPYGEGGGGLIAGWGQLIWRKCPPPTPPAHRPCQCVPNLFYNPTTLTASFLALSQKEDGKCLRPKVCGSSGGGNFDSLGFVFHGLDPLQP